MNDKIIDARNALTAELERIRIERKEFLKKFHTELQQLWDNKRAGMKQFQLARSEAWKNFANAKLEAKKPVAETPVVEAAAEVPATEVAAKPSTKKTAKKAAKKSTKKAAKVEQPTEVAA